MKRIAIAAMIACAIAATAHAEDDHGLGPLYRPGDGWVGHALVRDIRAPLIPACVFEADMDAFTYAVDHKEDARVLRMTEEGKCTFLQNESWGEILGATPSGGGYLRLRMNYVHGLRELDGIEVFVPVMSLRNLNRPDQSLLDTYRGLLGQ